MPQVDIPCYEAWRQRRFFGSLDGFRAISIILVIWHHTQGSISGVLGSARGFLGVDMFFVISGFLIVTLLLREREKNGQISLKSFYIRRTLRIFPVYYATLAAVAFTFLVIKPGANSAAPFFDELPYYLTYTSNWISASVLGIMWSLACEEQFYLLWPPLEKYARKAALPFLFCFIVFNQLINFRLLDNAMASIGLRYEQLEVLQITFTPICLGVLLAHLLHKKETFTKIAALLGHRWAPIVLTVTVVMLINVPVEDIGGWPRLLIQLNMMLLLAACVIREDNALAPLLRWRPLARIGVVSYGMYIFHMFVRDGGDRLLQKLGVALPGALFLVCLMGSWLIAELSFRLLEMPFLKLKTRFERTSTHH